MYVCMHALHNKEFGEERLKATIRQLKRIKVKKSYDKRRLHNDNILSQEMMLMKIGNSFQMSPNFFLY